MKTKNQLIAFLVNASTSLLAISSASAQSGNWLGNGSAWNDTAAWLDDIIATGSGNTANFTGVDLTVDVSMLLGENRTIGSIIFTDDTTASNNLTLTGNTLTLAGTPVIDVTQAGRTLTIGSILAGTSGFTKNGLGTLSLTATNPYSGTTTVSAGTVTSNFNPVSPAVNSLGASAVSIASGTILRIDRTGLGNGTITNTFTGSGILVLNHIQAGGAGRNTTMNNVTGFNGTIRLTTAASGPHKWVIGGDLTVPGSLVVETGSTLYMSAGAGTATFTGGITVSGAGNAEGRGALRLVGTLAGPLTLAGSTTVGAGGGRISGNITSGAAGTQTLTIGINASGGGDAGNFTLSGAIGGGTGTINIFKPYTSNNLTGMLTLSGANTYTGTTTIGVGTLKLGANNVLPDTSNIILGNATAGTATLDADTRTDTTGTLDVIGTCVIKLGTGVALAFADSKAVDWTGGTLNVTGTLGATSLRFGDSADDITAAQLGLISVNGSGAGTYVLDANGYLVLGGSAYDTWKAANAPGSNPQDDTDGDGVPNAVEFVLGGTSLTNDLSKLPVLSTSGTNMTFTFQRAISSIDPKTAVFIETSTDLVTWNTAPSPYTVPDTAVANVPGITVVEDTAVGFDTVTLTVPQAPDTKKFARLKVTIIP